MEPERNGCGWCPLSETVKIDRLAGGLVESVRSALPLSRFLPSRLVRARRRFATGRDGVSLSISGAAECITDSPFGALLSLQSRRLERVSSAHRARLRLPSRCFDTLAPPPHLHLRESRRSSFLPHVTLDGDLVNERGDEPSQL